VVASLSRAGWLALAATAPFLAYGAARVSGRAPRPARVAATALLAAAVLGGVVFALARNGRLGEPLRHRFEQVSSGPPEPRRFIWRAALAMFRERPLTGVGLDAFQLGFQRHRSLDFWRAEGHTTPQKAHTSGQKASGCSTDQRYREGKSTTGSAPKGRRSRMWRRNAVRLARRTRSAPGVQIGLPRLKSSAG